MTRGLAKAMVVLGLAFMPGRLTLAQRALKAASFDSLMRLGTEAVFENQMRQIGCKPLAAGGTGRAWAENERAAANAVRQRILGFVPVAGPGRSRDNTVYVSDTNYAFGRILIDSRLAGIPTFAYFMQSTTQNGDRPLVLLLHGSGTLPHQAFGLRLNGEGGTVTRPDSTPFIGLGLALARGGFTVIAPIIGVSPPLVKGGLPWAYTSLAGEIFRQKSSVGGSETLLLSELEAYIDYAEANGLSGNGQVYVVGWNEGAYLGTILAGYDARVRAVVRLEAPFDRRGYRNGAGLRRDASWAHAECEIGDVAQASLLQGKPLMYAAAVDDANEVARRGSRASSVIDSLKLLYSALGKSDAFSLELSGLKSVGVQTAVTKWLRLHAGLTAPMGPPILSPRVPKSIAFSQADVSQRINDTGNFLGALPSCGSILPRVATFDNNPQAISRMILTALEVVRPTRPASRILSRTILDSARGYRLSRVLYGSPGGPHWTALLAEPFGSGPRPAIMAFNGNDGLQDLFAIEGFNAHYMHGYADELARRGFVVMVPIIPGWVPDTYAAIASARSSGRATSWDILIDTYMSALDALIAIPEVDPAHVAGYGISFAGIEAAIVTAADPRISALVYNDVPINYTAIFDKPAGAFTNIWLADACKVADASLLAIAPRQLIWEAGEDPLALNENMDVVERVRERYRWLGREDQFTFTRHSGAHETFPQYFRIFGR
jgi:hypothetical protein